MNSIRLQLGLRVLQDNCYLIRYSRNYDGARSTPAPNGNDTAAKVIDYQLIRSTSAPKTLIL